MAPLATEVIGLPDPAVFIRNILLLFTAVGGAFAAYLAIVYDIPWFFKDMRRKDAPLTDRLLFLWWAIVLIGITLTSYVIGKLLLHVPRVQYTVDLAIYGAGATMIFIGLVGIAIGYARGGRRKGPLGDGKSKD